MIYQFLQCCVFSTIHRWEKGGCPKKKKKKKKKVGENEVEKIQNVVKSEKYKKKKKKKCVVKSEKICGVKRKCGEK